MAPFTYEGVHGLLGYRGNLMRVFICFHDNQRWGHFSTPCDETEDTVNALRLKYQYYQLFSTESGC